MAGFAKHIKTAGFSRLWLTLELLQKTYTGENSNSYNKIYCFETKPYKLHTILVSEFIAFVLNEMGTANQIDDMPYKKPSL